MIVISVFHLKNQSIYKIDKFHLVKSRLSVTLFCCCCFDMPSCMGFKPNLGIFPLYFFCPSFFLFPLSPSLFSSSFVFFFHSTFLKIPLYMIASSVYTASYHTHNIMCVCVCVCVANTTILVFLLWGQPGSTVCGRISD